MNRNNKNNSNPMVEREHIICVIDHRDWGKGHDSGVYFLSKVSVWSRKWKFLGVG